MVDFEPPSLRPRSIEEYNRDFDSRVREQDMESTTLYSYMTKVLWSHHGDVFEFPAQLTRIELNELRSSELGKASLSLMIYENDGETPLLSLDATSTEGLIVPTSPRRISHPALGHVGIVSDGYLLGSSQNPSLVRLHRPYSLDSHEPKNQRDESYSSIAS